MTEDLKRPSRSPAITLADDIYRLFFSKEGYVPSEDRFWKADEWRLVMAALRAYGSSETGTKISAEQLAEVKDQCELGLQVEHDCPAMFALAAIYADLFTNAEPETATKISPWISVTDRQPEKDGTYLTIKRGDALAEAGTTPFHEGEWIWGDGGIIRKTDPDLQVEWWMPVPSLPERPQSTEERVSARIDMEDRAAGRDNPGQRGT